MFKKFLLFLGLLFPIGSFAGSYKAPSEAAMNRSKTLRQIAGLENIEYTKNLSIDEIIEQTGRLCACYTIEEELDLPREYESIYIDPNEAALEKAGLLDASEETIIQIMETVLEKIFNAGCEFSDAAATCLQRWKNETNQTKSQN